MVFRITHISGTCASNTKKDGKRDANYGNIILGILIDAFKCNG